MHWEEHAHAGITRINSYPRRNLGQERTEDTIPNVKLELGET